MAATVNVDLNTTNQTIRGFGGMNFPRWIGTLTNAQVDTAFGNGSGQIGLTILRCDVPPSTGNWSGEVSAAVRAISHGAIVFASPWSPPASYKYGGSTTGGYLLPEHYDDFANYLSDFADYMSSNGAPLYAISVQNEPDYLPSYESCGYTAEQMLAFLNSSASVIPTRVIAPEITGFDSDYMDTVASSSECNIVAIHIYGGGGYYSYPGKEYWMTEHYTTSNVSGDLWPDALEVGTEIHDCMINNMNAYVWWYIRRSYGPIAEDGHITKRGYVMSQFAKFVRPGYIRINATENPSSGVYVTAYKEGSTLVIVAINQNSSSSSVTFSLSGGTVDSFTKYETTSSNNVSDQGSVGSTDTLAANSISTYVGTIYSGPQQTLNCSSTTGGSVIVPGEGDFQYTQDSNATIVAEADQYYHFDIWSGSAVTAGKVADPCAISTTVLMDANYAVIANFEADPLDFDPPEPNVMTWEITPYATSSSAIAMRATTATDDSEPVYYYFECTTDSDANSPTWQTDPNYTAQGLMPSTQYTFKVKARDSALTPNETGWSDTASATTGPPPTDVEILGDWVTGTTHTAESGYSRALIFIAHAEDDGATELTSVTYGDQSMTKIMDQTVTSNGYYAYVAAYILDEDGITAASGSTFNPSWSVSPDDTGYISVFLGSVDQTDPIGESDDNSTTSSSTLTTSALNTNEGDMVFVGATCGNVSNYTINNAFTETIEIDMSSSTGSSGYKSATGVPETPSVTTSNLNRQVIIGFVVQSVPSVVDYPPATPTGLVATAGNDQVSLDWADNGEADLAGYYVYRSTTSGGTYSLINGSLVVDSNYVDNDVNNFNYYYYVVTAVDSNDNESGYSNEDSAVPAYQTCADVQAADAGLVSDLTGNCYVDLEDLQVLASYWLNTNCAAPGNCGGADFAPTDGDVDLFDYSDFAVDWMECDNPEDANCPQSWWPTE
jgi:O-glycosyl hydrolase